MADHSGIEWTDATWSPVLGCTRVSEGCDSCYAIRTAHRMAHNPNPTINAAFEGLTTRTPARLDWTGKVRLLPDRLDWPLRWRKPRRIFVCSQADLFHDDVPDDYIARVFAVMALTDRHTYQVLTKRHGRMRSLLNSDNFRTAVAEHARVITRSEPHGAWRRNRANWYSTYTSHGELLMPDWPLPNVHLGVSAENQQWANVRIPALLDTPAAIRWVSAEPLLGPIDLTRVPYRSHAGPIALNVLTRHFGNETGPVRTRFSYGLQHLGGITWVVTGGESGPGARPMHPDWARSLRDQCEAAGVAFHFKQAGTVLASEWGCRHQKGGDPTEWPEPFPREYPALVVKR